MKKYLITLLIIPTLIFADAVIFSGSDVKTLKPNIDLFGVAKILTTSTIPTAGLTAPKGSIAMYTTTGDLYLKTGALNTDWTKNQTGPVNLTTDVTGILPIANGGTGSATQNFVGLTTAQNIAGLKNFTDALTITSNSANSLLVGPNGTTNPVFQVDSSTASQATGIKITGGAAGSGVIIGATSSGAADSINILPKAGGNVNLQPGGTTRYSAGQTVHAWSTAATASPNTKFLFTGAADTAITASTEASSIYYNLGQTRQHATGALSLQRDFRVSSSTHSFVGASTLTNAAALAIDGPANGGTNATITNSSALYIPTSALTNVTNSYGLNVAASTGATNNYAGIFTGGNVGIGTNAPSAKLHISDGTDGAKFDLTTNGSLVMTTTNSAGNINLYPDGTLNLGTSNTDSVVVGRTDVSGFSTRVNSFGGETMRIIDGNVGIGVTSPNANAILDVTSTTKAFMPPRMTTAQKNAISSPTAGMVVYDSDMKGISFYDGTAWTTTNNKNVATKTANYTALQSDDVILGDATSGAITITLPTAVGFSGKVFNIKKTDSSINSVTIATTSSQTIDGALTAPLISQYQSLTLVSNGTNWSVL